MLIRNKRCGILTTANAAGCRGHIYIDRMHMTLTKRSLRMSDANDASTLGPPFQPHILRPVLRREGSYRLPTQRAAPEIRLIRWRSYAS